MTTLLTVLVPLMDEVPAPNDVNPGAIGSLVVGAIVLATVLLWFSMRRHVRKVNFEVDEPGNDQALPDEGPDRPGPAS